MKRIKREREEGPKEDLDISLDGVDRDDPTNRRLKDLRRLKKMSGVVS